MAASNIPVSAFPPAHTDASPEEVLRESLKNILQQGIDGDQWKGRDGPNQFSSPRSASTMQLRQTQDPWGFAELPVTRSSGAGPQS